MTIAEKWLNRLQAGTASIAEIKNSVKVFASTNHPEILAFPDDNSILNTLTMQAGMAIQCGRDAVQRGQDIAQAVR